jgi:hypothetical protein
MPDIRDTDILPYIEAQAYQNGAPHLRFFPRDDIIACRAFFRRQ